MESQSSYLIMMVVLIAVMYFLMIRPENKRRKQAQEMRENLKKGDIITSAGGIVGKIVHINPDTVIIETSEDRVRVELTKWAISSVGLQSGEQAVQKTVKLEKKEPVQSDQEEK